MRHRVLLLEDDANLGQIVQEHLQMQGFEVTLCVDGEDGMKAFAQGQFDLCLIDIMMPRKDGFAFARGVRQRDQQTPLHLAARGGHDKAVAVLAARALVNARGRQGQTPLHYAVQAEHDKVIAILHEVGGIE